MISPHPRESNVYGLITYVAVVDLRATHLFREAKLKKKSKGL